MRLALDVGLARLPLGNVPLRCRRTIREAAASGGGVDVLMTAPGLTQAETSETYVSDEAARAEYIAAARSAAWRRRLLPAGAAILLLVLWELAVIVFHVRPFIAPAPTAVAATLYAKFGLLIGNLVPTATEAVTELSSATRPRS